MPDKLSIEKLGGIGEGMVFKKGNQVRTVTGISGFFVLFTTKTGSRKGESLPTFEKWIKNAEIVNNPYAQ